MDRALLMGRENGMDKAFDRDGLDIVMLISKYSMIIIERINHLISPAHPSILYLCPFYEEMYSDRDIT